MKIFIHRIKWYIKIMYSLITEKLTIDNWLVCCCCKKWHTHIYIYIILHSIYDIFICLHFFQNLTLVFYCFTTEFILTNVFLLPCAAKETERYRQWIRKSQR